MCVCCLCFFFFQAEDGIRDYKVTGVQTCALPILDPVDPSATLKLDAELLASFPEGYRHLAYLQSKIGFPVRKGLPGLKGASVEKIYAEGKAWLAGSEKPGDPNWA